jgi:hypothetical protein
MSIILSDLRDAIVLKLGTVEAPKLAPPPEALNQFIDAGVIQFSHIRPRRIVNEINGDGSTRRFILSSSLTNWVEDFSGISKVYGVSDANDNNETQTPFDADEWEVRPSVSSGSILFIGRAVGTSDVLRLIYTTTHVVDASAEADTSITAPDKEALITVCAIYGAYWIARKSMDLANTQMGVNEDLGFGQLRDHWRQRAKDLTEEAATLLGSKSIIQKSAAVSIQWDPDSKLTKRPRLFH